MTHRDDELAQLLARTTEPAFILDPLEDRFVAANTAGCAMLGYALGELLETPVSRIHPGEISQLEDFVSEVLADGHGSTIKLTCRTRAGGNLPAELTLWAFDGGGRICLLALIHDRSEHRDRPPADRAAVRRRPRLRASSNPSHEGREHPMVTAGLIVRLEAKAGKEDELASFLVSALPLVEDEPGTVAWFSVRIGLTSFAIVDVFPDAAGRRAHLEGTVAAALLERAPDLLEKAPEIEPVDVLAAKLP